MLHLWAETPWTGWAEAAQSSCPERGEKPLESGDGPRYSHGSNGLHPLCEVLPRGGGAGGFRNLNNSGENSPKVVEMFTSRQLKPELCPRTELQGDKWSEGVT